MGKKKKTITLIDENTWWLLFFKKIGELSYNDSIAFADDLRQQGFSPEETAHKVSLYDQDLY
jgi:hypothetical protein